MTWHRYWLIWFLVAFAAFLGPEVYALCTNWRNTLSESIWEAERFVPGQSLEKWNAFHFLFAGAFLLVSVWLFGHFIFGLWR